MKSALTEEKLNSRLKSINALCRVVSVDHLSDLQGEIAERYEEAGWSKEFYGEYFSFDFQIPEDLPEAKSIIVVAVHQPIIQVSFSQNGQIHRGVVPPTYVYEIQHQIENILHPLLEPAGYKFVKAALPLKLLATQSGLAKYGKNNITFVPGMGSYHRLSAYYTNMPSIKDNWGKVSLMDECLKCEACTKNCPTGAIDPGRFLLRAERCLTFYNERTDTFPSWIDTSWHHCLIGCMFCQQCCPKNIKPSPWIDDAMAFSDKETALLLKGVTTEDIPSPMVQRLKDCGLWSALAIFPRNFQLLGHD